MEEFAWLLVFIGRPNAGKSSLIGRLTAVNPIIGKKPGSTRKINEYELAKKFKVVDVPGWGKIHSRSEKYEYYIKDKIVEFFEINHFRIFACIHIIDAKSLVDVNRRLEKKDIIPIDIELYHFLCQLGITPIVALNKSDKITPTKLTDALEHFKKQIEYSKLSDEAQREIITVSAKQGTNLPLLRDIIRQRLRKRGLEEFERYIKL